MKEKFKKKPILFLIDVLRTSQERLTEDVISGRFQDVFRTFLQNFKNMQ